MEEIVAGYPATVSFDFTDLANNVVVPTALSYRVFDEDETELVAATSVDVPAEGDFVEIEVPATINQLAEGVPAGARTVELTITTADGSVELTESYLVKSTVQLTAFNNSFQTYEGAIVSASMMANLDNWDVAEISERTRALAEAFRRLVRIGYRVNEEPVDLMDRVDGITHNIKPGHWTTMTRDAWMSLPANFRNALRRAQVTEANEILKATDPNEKRRLGIMAETVGESKMMFRAGKPVSLGISAAALQQLGGYVNYRMKIARR